MADRILTAEERKQLLGLSPFSGESVDHTPEKFEELKIQEDLRPVYTLTPYNREEIREIEKVVTKDETDIDFMVEKARQHTIGWSNVFDSATGKEIMFEADNNGCAKKELFAIGKMPITTITSIFKKVSLISGLSNPEKLGLNS